MRRAEAMKAQSEDGEVKSPRIFRKQAGRDEPGARCVQSKTKLKSPGITKITGVRVKPGVRPRGLRVCEVTKGRRGQGYWDTYISSGLYLIHFTSLKKSSEFQPLVSRVLKVQGLQGFEG